MCPDRQLLSVYLDGELPSPWKEKMEAHLSGCPQCRKFLENYRRLFTDMADQNGGINAVDIHAARERVWRGLEPRLRDARSRSVSRRLPGANIWRRTVSLPLPAAAAAAILVIVLAALWMLKPSQAAVPSPNMIVASEENLAPGMIPASDMNSVIQYLGGSGDGSDILILRLPESRSFISSGEPAIVRAADYSRNAPARRQP